MSDTDTATTTELNGEVQQQETEQPTLQQRLGRVLSRDDHVSSDELRSLIRECTDAIAEADGQAQYHHQQTLDIACDNPRAAKEQERECVLVRQRLLIAQSRVEEKLAKVVGRENRDKWQSDRNKVAAKRDEASRQFREVPDYFADLVAIFQLAEEVDREVARINQSKPGDVAALATTELHARKMEGGFSKSQPSIIKNTALPDWAQSDRNVWPPRPQSLGVLVAAAMMPAPDVRYSDRWYEAQADRRAAQEADQQRTAEYYARQEQERQEREAREDQERRAQRSG